MAPAEWSNLPTDILSLIAKILNNDVDIIRLRSVCSSWRASVRPRPRPSPFPLRFPPLLADSATGGHVFLNYTTIFHLSPPKHGPHAGDPSDGWLFRVSEVNPNRFSVVAPLFPKKLEFPPGSIPKYLNLLDYRISEVCKCYSLSFFDGKDANDAWPVMKKVLVLWNYFVSCEFAVLALFMDGCMSYWKFGDTEWTPIDTMEYDVTDMAVCKGEFYAISRIGVLVSLDSNFNFTVVDFPYLPVICVENDNYLVEYKSDLYVVSKILEYHCDLEEDPNEIPLRLEIFKKCNDWKHVECLGNDMFFSSDDYSFGFSAEDFRRLKSNCVYMAHTDSAYSHCYGKSLLYGVYNLDKSGKTSIMKYAQDPTLIYWPPPGSLMSS